MIRGAHHHIRRKLILLWCLPLLAFSVEGVKTEQLLLIDLFYNGLKSGVACYRIPALASAMDGSLIAAADERIPSCADLGTNPNVNIVLRRSTDGGNTWEAPKVVVDFEEGISASDPSFITDGQNGDVLLFYNYMDHVREKGVYRFQFIRSSDHGITWSKPIDFTDQIMRQGWQKPFLFITSGNGTQTKDGKLLHTLAHVGEKAAYVIISADHGKSWKLIDRPLVPGDESRVVELSDGQWMVNTRVNGAAKRYTHTSADAGNSWVTAPVDVLQDPGCNAGLVVSGARLYFSHLSTPKERKNLTLKWSDNLGKTWDGNLTIYEGSSAYSSLVPMAGGNLGLLFERDDYTKITFVKIPSARLR